MKIQIIRNKISKEEIAQLAKESFGEMVKAVVDIKKGILAVGGEMHADAELELLDDGSKQGDLWGINLYPNQEKNQWVEFSSLINIRPSIGNRSMNVEDRSIQEKITNIVNKLVG